MENKNELMTKNQEMLVDTILERIENMLNPVNETIKEIWGLHELVSENYRPTQMNKRMFNSLIKLELGDLREEDEVERVTKGIYGELGVVGWQDIQYEDYEQPEKSTLMALLYKHCNRVKKERSTNQMNLFGGSYTVLAAEMDKLEEENQKLRDRIRKLEEEK